MEDCGIVLLFRISTLGESMMIEVSGCIAAGGLGILLVSAAMAESGAAAVKDCPPTVRPRVGSTREELEGKVSKVWLPRMSPSEAASEIIVPAAVTRGP